MDFGLGEEQEELAGLTDRILGDRMTVAHLKALDRSTDWFDRETWAELAKANLLGLALPEDLGGLGFGFLEACLLLQVQGRHVAPLPIVPALVQYAAPLAEFGTGAQRERVRAVIAGEQIGTAALTEPGAPLDRPATTATATATGWRLDGCKTTVPMLHLAPEVLVPATTDDGRIGLFLVPTDAGGLTQGRQTTTSCEPQFELVLDGVAIGDDALLGGDLDAGRAQLEWLVARTTVAYCALAAGVADRALRLTAQYTCDRKQFDRAIGTFQAVGQRMADAYIDATAIELTMLAAATHLAEGRAVPDEVATAKFWAAEGGSRVVLAALHVHGGISIDLDYPIHRYFLWMRQIENTLGGASVQLRNLGRMLADQPA